MLDYANLPQSPPNLVTFYVSGFYYRTIPEFYDVNGVKLIPLQFSIIDDELTYKYAFYKPAGPLCNIVWFMRTSDDIFPRIYEWVTQIEMKVERVSVYNGYTTWAISCDRK
uniref:Uncharacterized protein n=1 Tax=Marseillevirus LCMAC101 TaxID=2506602 RepID=A0A481YSE1_9VIRU|nr:MAG: hypothetical protein LCMAC101_02600 [Marseillevirus LCMAC101]